MRARNHCDVDTAAPSPARHGAEAAARQRAPGAGSAWRSRCGRVASALVVCFAGAAGCAAPRVTPGPLVDAAASERLYEAWRAQRVQSDADDERAAAGARDAESDLGPPRGLAEAAEAAALDPSWVAPQRILDEALRADLRGPEALARRLTALAATPDDPAALYLAGRLGGPGADRLLDRSVAADPSFGWGWHGLAWNAHRRGDSKRAVAWGEVALALARDPHEVAHFAHSLARYLLAVGRAKDAVVLLDRLVRGVGATGRPAAGLALRTDERLRLAVELTLDELATSDGEPGARGAAARAHAAAGVDATARAVRMRGARRGLELLAASGVSDAERLTLVRALAGQEQVTVDELLLALSGAAHGEGDGGGRIAHLRAELLDLLPAATGARRSPLALRWRGERAPTGSRQEVLDAFRWDEPSDALERWLATLPPQLKDVAGRPLRPSLAALTEATRLATPLADATEPQRVTLAEALLAAGWYDEAEALALRGTLPPGVAEWTLRRALAARTAFAAILSVLEAIDRGAPSELVQADGGGAFDVALKAVGSLGELLDAVRRRLVQGRLLGGFDPNVADLDAASPRIGYGLFATVVHPGPTFSAEDERLGRGPEGARVPGLALEFDALGRHALFGHALGQGGPDGSILKLVHTEQRAGEHLGRPFHGTVFWCCGADVPARFGRRGASVSGAALHEGYWVDLERVEAERDLWLRTLRRFTGDPARVRAALEVVGPRVERAARAQFDPTLGANDRMRLAWMVEQGDEAEPVPVSLAQLAEVVAVHEEGHLCDRAGWYPVRSHLLALLSFAAAHRFAPTAIAEALEERAQLVALACVPDPRLAWVDLLDAAERTDAGSAITPHAAGYRRLLGRLLERLSHELDTGDWPELDPERRLVDQLHRIAPEHLRALAVREARARGLTREP
ncbi:MAG: hypothetical protein R3F49_00485 [Planctomycetota bacterium]